MPITHLKVSAKPNSSDPSKIQPGDWNAPHVFDIYVDSETPNGVTDGENQIFELFFTPNPPACLQLFVNGVMQYQGVAYILTGNTIMFTAFYIPGEGSQLRAFYRKD